MSTSISYSDQGFILVGFKDGSIALFNSEYSSPLSIWYNTCTSGVKVVKWCSIYFTEGKRASSEFEDSRLANRLCEFFVLDESLKFYIWNLNKDIHKSVHQIDFS